MLILSRKVGEEIHLGEDIVIIITEISKGNVKIGIEAPKSMAILRGELKQKIEETNKMASQNNDISVLQKLSSRLHK